MKSFRTTLIITLFPIVLSGCHGSERVTQGQWALTYSGRGVSIVHGTTSIAQGLQAEYRLDDRIVRSSVYGHRSFSQERISDDYGQGRRWTITYTDEKLLSRDADYRMSPPLRTERDRKAVEEAVLDGTIDCIITDHAPHTAEEKADFLTARNGVVGLETSLASTLTKLYHTGKLSLSRIAELMSVNPRRILGLPEAWIRVGAEADLCVFDPELEWEVIPAELHSKSKNTVFKGEKFKGRNLYTICKGKLVFEFGKD
jgi:hypothetical protein